MDLLDVYESSNSSEEEEDTASKVSYDKDYPVIKKTEERDSSELKETQVDVLEFASTNSVFERSVPHVRGNWAGHIFLKLDDYQHGELYRMARRSISALRTKLQAAGWKGSIVSHVPWKDGDDTDDDSSSDGEANASSSAESHVGLHVSLSKPFYLQEASILSFVKDLRDRLSCEPSLTVKLGGPPHVLVNDEKTRSFWCMPVSCTTPSLSGLISHVDQVMVKYRQPTYYHPPLMHASLASIPGNVESLLVTNNTNSTKDGLKEHLLGSIKAEHPFLISIRDVHCTFGTTKAFSIRLREL